MAFIFSNLVGAFVFDENFHVKEQIIFRNLSDYQNKSNTLSLLQSKYPDAKHPEGKQLSEILAYFKKKEFFHEFYRKNIDITRIGIRNSVAEDLLIIQAVGCIEDLDKAINLLAKRLREWYGLHNPEFSRSIENNEKFAQIILKKKKEELLKELNIKKEESIGADLKQDDLDAIMELASEIVRLCILRKKQEDYIGSAMKNFCPNLMAVAGVLTGAKLIEQAGGLKKLSIMTSSTIQILGAEKALFRHMKTGAKPPKYGLIYSHTIIQKQKHENQGKAARALADKISIAVKVDYFKGEFIGEKLRKELEDKFVQR